MALKQREPRQAVHVPARLRTDLGWGDVEIKNVSHRGVMGGSASPPSRGTFIEIRRGSYVIVGRVMWSREDRFGVSAQDSIELNDLLKAHRQRPHPGPQRRQLPRQQPRTRSITELTEASVRFSRVFDFVIVILAVGSAAIFAAQLAFSALSAPLQTIELAMRHEGQ